MATVMIPLAEGFEEIEAVALIDVIRRGGIDVVVAAVGNELLVRGAHGVIVRCDAEAESVTADEIDMIVLPGGWGGTKALAQDAHIQELLREMDAKGKRIGAICAAPYALEKAGVLKERYTCYPDVVREIREAGYEGDRAVVTDGNVMTSRGPGTAICFALEIVGTLAGDATRKKVQTGLLATCSGAG